MSGLEISPPAARKCVGVFKALHRQEKRILAKRKHRSNELEMLWITYLCVDVAYAFSFLLLLLLMSKQQQQQRQQQHKTFYTLFVSAEMAVCKFLPSSGPVRIIYYSIKIKLVIF